MTSDPRYGTVTVAAWHVSYPKLAGRRRWSSHEAPPILKGTVIRVEVEHLPKLTARTKKTLWLLWSGKGTPDLDLCWGAYLCCGALTLSMPSGSRRTRSVGLPRHCARRPRPSGGRGSWPPCSPSSAWLASRLMTSAFPGSDHANHANSRPCVSGEGFVEFVH
ncbi:MAG: hypothetical protein ACYCZ8_13405 [Acidimicrobiales bacterium]